MVPAPDCYGNVVVSANAYRKSNFFITFGYLVFADQSVINYKSRSRRKLTKTTDFSQILICHSIDRSMHMQQYSFVSRQKKYETYKQDTLSMSNAIRRPRLNHWTKDERNPSKLQQLFQMLQQVLFISTNLNCCNSPILRDFITYLSWFIYTMNILLAWSKSSP